MIGHTDKILSNYVYCSMILCKKWKSNQLIGSATCGKYAMYTELITSWTGGFIHDTQCMQLYNWHKMSEINLRLAISQHDSSLVYYKITLHTFRVFCFTPGDKLTYTF